MEDNSEYIETEIAKVEPSENSSNETVSKSTDASMNENKRNFIDLNYLDNMDNVNYMLRYIPLDIDYNEFTWWDHYTIEEYLLASEYYNFVLPDDIDGNKHDIVISFGHKLKHLYYYESDYITDPFFEVSEEWYNVGYRARPVFETDFVKKSAYVYLIDKTDLADSEIASDEFDTFKAGNIPFELPPND